MGRYRVSWTAETIHGLDYDNDGATYWQGLAVTSGEHGGDIVAEGPRRATEAEAQADADDLVHRLRDAEAWAETAASLMPGCV